MKQQTILTLISVIALIGVTTISLTTEYVDAETLIPDWIKNNAKWWSEGKISDDDFSTGIEYMVKVGIIKV